MESRSQPYLQSFQLYLPKESSLTHSAAPKPSLGAAIKTKQAANMTNVHDKGA